MPTYRTAGVWGPGIGVNLTPAMVDANFYELRTAIDDLIASPPTADSVVSVSQSGFDLTFHTTLGNALGPLTMPVVQFRWRGEWSPLTLYEAADTFIVTGTGLFTVMADHTSAATFDPDATGGSPAEALYNQLFGVGTNTTLDDLSDVSAGSPVAGQVLRYIGGSPDALWQPDTLVLDDLGDVSAAAPSDGDVLTYQAGSPTGWIASAPAAVPSTLDSLTDVSVPSPADGDFLRYEAGSPAGWINEAGTAISGLGAATLPVNTASLLEISEASGSPITYESKRITIADLLSDVTLTNVTLSGATTLPGSGSIDSSGRLGLGTAPTAANWLTVAGTSLAVAAFERTDASDSLVSVFTLRRSRSDATAPGSGFGASFTFNLEAFTNNTLPTAAQISSTWENAQTNDTTDRNSDLRFSTMLANTISAKAKLTSAGLFILGPNALATTAFPALKRSSATLQVRLGDDSAYADFYCRNTVQNPQASVTPANNGELVVEATSNTSLTFKLKGTDGTVRSGGITLA